MNIFETRTGFSGRFDPDSTGGSLLSLLTLARDIRLKLGRQGYLLDNYLSLFLDAANAVLILEAAENGFERGNELRSLCFDVISQNSTKKDHPLYDTAVNTLTARTDILHYQEPQTRMNLLYAILSDEFIPFISEHFGKIVNNTLSTAYDSQQLINLFECISEVVGESLMGTLNLRLKQHFLLVPLVSVFAQGVTNDLLYCLTSRDRETSKQVFQLLLDSIPEDKDE